MEARKAITEARVASHTHARGATARGRHEGEWHHVASLRTRDVQLPWFLSQAPASRCILYARYKIWQKSNVLRKVRISRRMEYPSA